MPVHNNDIAAAFEEIADLLDIEGANAFRVRAYRNAARVLRGLSTEVSEMLKAGRDLSELPGIGKDLAGKIGEVVKTGSCDILKKLHKELPPALGDLMKIPGLGPKRVSALYYKLGIRSLAQLTRAAQSGRIAKLPGFGAKIEETIRASIGVETKKSQRFKLAVAAQVAEGLTNYLKRVVGVERVVVAGSFRRAKETVGDLDIVVTAKAKSPVMDRFAAYGEVAKVLAKGETKTTVKLRSGLQVDLRLLPPESFGAALYYFTGSKAHNIAVRSMALKRGLKINEYGVFRGKKRVAGETEDSVFRCVKLPFIPPELRENRGEIEAAAKGKLPALIEPDDLCGDLHVHSQATDGANSIREMAAAAKKLSLGYIALAEPSRGAGATSGLDAKALRKQMAEIDKLNAEKPGVVVLKGIEAEILEDGSFDPPADVLAGLDLVVATVRSAFKLPRAKQTARILKAMEHPSFSILAQPMGAHLPEGGAFDLDMPRIIRGAKERGCFLELNCHPERLDLADVYCQMAKSEGVLIAVSCDARGIADFGNLRYGVGEARRGWLEKGDVLNARPLKALLPLLKRTMAGA